MQVCTGEHFSCALLNTGSVNCWGDNSYGQIGDGQVCGSNNCYTPAEVSGISTAGQLECSNQQSACVVLSDDTAMCWGRNNEGQLGDGSTTTGYVPVPVTGLGNVDEIECGSYHCCALLNDGAVKCWGRNNEGQLGDNRVCGTGRCTTPVDVSGIDGITYTAIDIGMGSYHSCAVLDTGSIKCWGRNNYGQLGDGSTTDKYIPTDVLGISNAVKVDAGNSDPSWEWDGFTCAVLSDGTAKCWGENDLGYLGDGTTVQRNSPVVASGISNAVDVYLGVQVACFSFTDSTIRCIGDNSNGQLGDGTNVNKRMPVEVWGI